MPLNYSLITIALFLSFSCISQQHKQDNKFVKLPFFVLEISHPKEGTRIKLPFKALKIIDHRNDTSAIGFHENNIGKVSKIIFNLPIDDALNRYAHSAYSFDSINQAAPELLLVIKKFWVTPTFDSIISSEKQFVGPAFITQVEAYAKYDVLFKPIIRINQSHLLSNAVKNTLEDQTGLVFQKWMEAILLKPEKFEKGNKMLTSLQFESYNKDIDKPVITSGTLSKGVYRTFNEFIANAPFHTSYGVQSGSLSDIVHLKDSQGKEYPERNIWGYCDGKDAFIKLGDNFYKLFRSGNCFYLYGAKEITQTRHVKVGNLLLLGVLAGGFGKQNSKTVYTLIPKPYMLDLNTGEVF